MFSVQLLFPNLTWTPNWIPFGDQINWKSEINVQLWFNLTRLRSPFIYVYVLKFILQQQIKLMFRLCRMWSSILNSDCCKIVTWQIVGTYLLWPKYSKYESNKFYIQ